MARRHIVAEQWMVRCLNIELVGRALHTALLYADERTAVCCYLQFCRQFWGRITAMTGDFAS